MVSTFDVNSYRGMISSTDGRRVAQSSTKEVKISTPSVRPHGGLFAGVPGAPSLTFFVKGAIPRTPTDYKSLGFNPVFLAMRASIAGPISSLSWKAKTKCPIVGCVSFLWEPTYRRNVQPILSSAL